MCVSTSAAGTRRCERLMSGTTGKSRRRSASLSAHGGPAHWLMAGALFICLTMIFGLLGIIVVNGMSTFWPRPIQLVELQNGERVLGIQMREEPYEPSAEVYEQIERLREAGELPEWALDDEGRPLRRMYRVGNRDIRGVDDPPDRWIRMHEVVSIELPEEAVLLERTSWGVWLGFPREVVIVEELPADAELFEGRSVETPYGPGVAVREPSRRRDGTEVVIERIKISGDAVVVMRAFRRMHGEARERRLQMRRLERAERGRINQALESWRLRMREAEIRARETEAGIRRPIAAWWWGLILLGTAVSGVGAVLSGRRLADGVLGHRRTMRLVRVALWCLTGLGLLAVAMEHPWSGPSMPPKRLAELQAEYETAVASLEEEGERVDDQLRAIQEEDRRYRVAFEEPTTGRIAPLERNTPEDPMPVSRVVRAVEANSLGLPERLGVYASRWWEFLSDDPREANTEGGVFPVIFGTVMLTILLSIAVVPLGVIAAIYIREYARQGVVTSTIRIAVNNLAGVPSIVYGVFGLGFFCYTVGGFVDAGPTQPIAKADWWLLGAGAGLLVFGAVGLSVVAISKRSDRRLERALRWVIGGVWLGAVCLIVAMIATTPYFTGFFRANLPSPTYGGRGILWASLTLALLTLPVVIVSTEEAISAVPGSMREGSYGCGASRWQTIRRIVLPGSMPGILTGAILAMARGAGEVAPLMLVGAVMLAPQLPVSGEFPFIHPERSFMHLGFHIYDLGFQSPDSEAAQPLVWTTTLLLIMIVLLLNLVAIALRARLRTQKGVAL